MTIKKITMTMVQCNGCKAILIQDHIHMFDGLIRARRAAGEAGWTWSADSKNHRCADCSKTQPEVKA